MRPSKTLTVAALAVATAGIVGVTASADDPPSDQLLWQVLNGRTGKFFQVLDPEGTPISDEQFYDLSKDGGRNPSFWELIDEPALVEVDARGGAAYWFGGRQRHGVASEGEGGQALDTISEGETLIIRAGDDLEQGFAGISNLRLQGTGDIAPGTVFAVIQPTFDDIAQGPPIEFELEQRQLVNGKLRNVVQDVDADFGSVTANGVEFGVRGPGSYGIKGFKAANGFTTFELGGLTGLSNDGDPATTVIEDGDGNRTEINTECWVPDPPILDGDGDPVDGCADKPDGIVPLSQAAFIGDGGDLFVDVIPRGEGGGVAYLRTTVVREVALDDLYDGLEPILVDFDAEDGVDDFVPLLFCGDPAFDPTGLPDADPSSPTPAACLRSFDADTSSSPAVLDYRVILAADPRFQFR